MNTSKKLGRKNICNLDHSKKMEIIGYLEQNSVSQRTCAEIFNVSLGTINKIFRQKEDLKKFNIDNHDSKKKRKLTKTEEFDDLLFNYIQNLRKKNFPISKNNIAGFAMYFATKFEIKDFKASNGYVEKFVSGIIYH